MESHVMVCKNIIIEIRNMLNISTLILMPKSLVKMKPSLLLKQLFTREDCKKIFSLSYLKLICLMFFELLKFNLLKYFSILK